MSDWQVLEGAWHFLGENERAIYDAALARLREREAKDAELHRIELHHANAKRSAAEARVQELEASLEIEYVQHLEARVQELEGKLQEVEHPFDKPEYDAMFARVQELEEALREIADPENDSSELRRIARRALKPRAEA